MGDEACDDKCTTGKQLRNAFRLGTWKVQMMRELGNLYTVCNEMGRDSIDMLVICETNWKNRGSFRTHDNMMMIFTEKDEGIATVMI